MHAGVAVGLLALGESLPTSQSGRTLRLASWLFIAVGVAMLANGQGRCYCQGMLSYLSIVERNCIHTFLMASSCCNALAVVLCAHNITRTCIQDIPFECVGGYREFKSTLFHMMPVGVISKLPPKWTASFRATQRTELPTHAIPSLQRSLSGKVTTV